MDKRQHCITRGGEFFCQRFKCQTNLKCSSDDSSCLILFAHTSRLRPLKKLFHLVIGAEERHKPPLLIQQFPLKCFVSRLVQSVSTSCLPLYLDALEKLTPWFFPLAHVNYSRWLPVHLHDLLTLKKRLPRTYSMGSFSMVDL